MMIVLICLVIIGFILAYIGFSTVLASPIKKRIVVNPNQSIPVQQLGLIEGGIVNLKEVIIIADRIEEPTNELYDSVKKNFKKGVKYIFLISEKNYIDAKNSYWKIFQAIADVVKYHYHIENLVEIHSINFEWNDYPYIFYRFLDTDGSQKAVAYMGTQEKEGIADEYELINPTLALKILNLAFARITIPEYETIRKEELSHDLPTVLTLSEAV